MFVADEGSDGSLLCLLQIREVMGAFCVCVC